MKRKTFILSMALIVIGMTWNGALHGTSAKKSTPIKNLIQKLEIGDPITYGNLTIIPVYSFGKKQKTNIFTLDEAFKNNWIKITEIDGGRVPEVRITNRTKHKIFLMGGEILSGCKQDRIVAGDVLLRPYSKDLKVPVYCVEHGRWNSVSESFYSKDNLGTYAMRAQAQTKAPSAQIGIWEKIASENKKLGVDTATSAYQAAYDKTEHRSKIRKIEKELQQIPFLNKDTIGVVIGLGGRIASVDVFADPVLFQRQWPKLLKSSALSSISIKRPGILSQQKAIEFFQYLINKEFISKTALDLGREFSLTDTLVIANALEYQAVILHLAGFPQETIGGKSAPAQDLEQRVRVIRTARQSH